jgi:hypothetical protein
MVKTTVELPDDLARRIKAEAALRGRKLKDLIADGVRLKDFTVYRKRGRVPIPLIMPPAGT